MLSTYREKRNFGRTPEPSGDRAAGEGEGWSFVVQKHAARRLHYDFRLELDGVLLSWAVPKGPSLDPKQRRLAMRTEDHPLDYADFEGVIPEGEYGGGAVIVWDRGRWRPEEDAAEGLAKGRLKFELIGEKLRGSWRLIRTASGKDGRERWLLFKARDEAATSEVDLVETRPESVISGRTLEEVASDPGQYGFSR